MKNYLYIFVLLITIGCSTPEQKPQHTAGLDPATEEKIEALLSQMTLKEKAGQMLNIGLPSILKGDYWDARDTADFDAEKFEKFIVEYGTGSIHNTPGFLANNQQWFEIVKKIQDKAMNDTRLGIPILYGIDNIHGANYIAGSVMFPHQIAMAATWNRELNRIGGQITSYESRSASLPWNFNPNADVAMSPLWGRISESSGEDPYLISEMTNAYIQGSQELGFDHKESSAVCLKHFIGYGAGRNGKDRANALIPENSLQNYFLPPFEEAVKAGAMGVMISSNSVNGIPCHINKRYITDILKNELGFQGVVISDFSDVEFLMAAHHSVSDMREATKMAVNAGLDLLMNPYDADVVDIIVELVEAGEISNERIDDAVRRNLRLKYALNLFDQPYNNPTEYPDFGSEKHIAANYQAASEAITLLKNEDNVLPLQKGKKVLVTGYAANSMNLLNGAWSRTFLGQDPKYNDPTKLTILKAIEKEVGEKNVMYTEGTDYTNDINTSKAVSLGRNADYIVVCTGELPATEKPSDINELDLPEAQQNLVKELSKLNKPIILVMAQGRPRIIKDIEPLAKGILMAYYPGQEGGRAVSDILYGNVNPSGKLPYTYPMYTGNFVTYYHKKTDIRDTNWAYEGFYPQFEFGFGLSYTEFNYTNYKISNETISNGETVTVSADVTNSGAESGKETVQLYLKDLVSLVAPDSKRLIRFEKIALNPGETKTVAFELNSDDFKTLSMENEWHLDPGGFELQIGSSSLKVETKAITLK